jgi:undecaprenyl-diphosphatase
MDHQLLFLLNQKWIHPVLDWFLATLSCLAFWNPILVLIALWLGFRHGLRGCTFVIICALGVTANEYVVSQPLKTLTKKARPHEALAHVRRVDLAQAKPRLLAITKPVSVSFSGEPNPNPSPNTRRSFPSAHVMNATTLGLAISLCWRSFGWLLLPPLMAWSRVYTGAHWPSDVFWSMLMGTAFTLSYLFLFELLWQRWIARVRPQWTGSLPRLVIPSAFPPKTR